MPNISRKKGIFGKLPTKSAGLGKLLKIRLSAKFRIARDPDGILSRAPVVP